MTVRKHRLCYGDGTLTIVTISVINRSESNLARKDAVR